MIMLVLFSLFSQWVLAQSSPSVMESSGKIYVVLATVIAIYIGIIVFLTIIEKKMSNLERQIKE